jgi:hypothetical protein
MKFLRKPTKDVAAARQMGVNSSVDWQKYFVTPGTTKNGDSGHAYLKCCGL